jgi:hypothetical protein
MCLSSFAACWRGLSLALARASFEGFCSGSDRRVESGIKEALWGACLSLQLVTLCFDMLDVTQIKNPSRDVRGHLFGKMVVYPFSLGQF